MSTALSMLGNTRGQGRKILSALSSLLNRATCYLSCVAHQAPHPKLSQLPRISQLGRVQPSFHRFSITYMSDPGHIYSHPAHSTQIFFFSWRPGASVCWPFAPLASRRLYFKACKAFSRAENHFSSSTELSA